MANTHRGEVNITLAGSEYTLRPTFNVIAQIEDSCGAGIVTLATSASNIGEMSLSDVTKIIYMLLVEQDDFKDISELGSIIMAEGVLSFMPIVAKCLMGVVTGGKEAKGKKRQVDTSPDTTHSEK